MKGHIAKHWGILNFKGPRELVDNLYKESKTDKLKSIIIKGNCWFICHQLKKSLPETFSKFFTLNTQLHKHNSRKNKFILPNIKTTSYGFTSITLKPIKQWNEILNFIKIDTYSSIMTYSKFLKFIENYIRSNE